MTTGGWASAWAMAPPRPRISPTAARFNGKPNNFQNYPVLTSAIVDTASNTTEIKGILGNHRFPRVQYTIQFFSNPTGDASGHGQGATYLGETPVFASNGSAVIDVFLPTALASGLYISAVAIGQTGNTSEFSATVQTQARVELNLSGSGRTASRSIRATT